MNIITITTTTAAAAAALEVRSNDASKMKTYCTYEYISIYSMNARGSSSSSSSSSSSGGSRRSFGHGFLSLGLL